MNQFLQHIEKTRKNLENKKQKKIAKPKSCTYIRD
jgi:hypothetical protein